MSALLDHAAAVQHDDVVRAYDRGQPVGDHDDRAVFGEPGERLLDHRLIFRVREGRGLVQHHDGRVLEDRPGQRHALLLAAGQIGALAADDGIHAVRQLFEDVVTLGGMQRRRDLLAGSVRPRGAHVFEDAGLEQPVVLEYEGHLIHQHMRVGLAHIHAADFYRAGAHIPEAGDQAGRGGLAAAGGTDEGHGLAGPDGEAHMVQRGQFRAIIGEGDILKRHAVVPGFLGIVCNLQRRGAHHLIDARQGCACEHRSAGGKHDLRQCRGDDGGEYRVERKVGDESREAPGGQRGRRDQQRHGHHEDERALRGRQVDGLGHLAHVRLVVLGLGTVILDGLFERPEGIHRLLEHLYDGDAAHVLGAGLAHDILGRLVLHHQARVFAGHHGRHGAHGDHRRQQAGRAHTPIEHEHQHQHGDKHGHGAYDIGQIVGQQRLSLGSRAVQPVAQQARGVGIEEAQRRLHQVGHARLPDVRSRAERRQVGAHQRGKVDDDARHREGEGHPSVAGDARRLRPVRRDGDQIPGHQPDADIGQHPQHHGHGGQSQTQECQPLVTARVAQQHGKLVLFFLFHEITSLELE